MAGLSGSWPQRRLRAPFLRGSAWLHGAGAVALATFPGRWPWILGLLLADHLGILAGCMWPRSGLIGPNLTRIPDPGPGGIAGVALTFDDGPDPDVTPEILRVLERRSIKATFFVVGARALKHPELVAETADRGHRVENHSHRHGNNFCLLGPRALGRELDRAQSAIEVATGRAPELFRAPAGLRSPWLDAVLVSRGLQLVSWTRRGFDTVDSDASRVLGRLVRDIGPGDILLLHDRGSARAPRRRPAVLEVLPRLLDEIERRGLRVGPIPTRHHVRAAHPISA